jgi:DNA-binding response OmpR family regulator
MEISVVQTMEYGKLECRLRAEIGRRATRLTEAPRTLLIIDDDPNIRQLLCQELAGEHRHIREAGSGVEALSMIDSEPPDLVILDVQMPHLNGFAVAARLRSDPVTLDLPIVLHTVAEDRKLGEHLGIDAYLTKPVIGSVLVETVRSLSSGKRVKKFCC